MKDLVGTTDLAGALGVSPQTVHNRLRRGLIPPPDSVKGCRRIPKWKSETVLALLATLPESAVSESDIRRADGEAMALAALIRRGDVSFGDIRALLAALLAQGLARIQIALSDEQQQIVNEAFGQVSPNDKTADGLLERLRPLPRGIFSRFERPLRRHERIITRLNAALNRTEGEYS